MVVFIIVQIIFFDGFCIKKQKLKCLNLNKKIIVYGEKKNYFFSCKVDLMLLGNLLIS